MLADQLLHVVSHYRHMHRRVFLDTICEMARQSGQPWSDNDQRMGGLVTERALDATGHIDVSFDNQCVSVGPRLLVAEPVRKDIAKAFLVGHRSANVVGELQDAVDRSECWLDRTPFDGRYPCIPDRLQITADSQEQLEQIATAVNATFVEAPPAQQLLEFSYDLSQYLASRVWETTRELNWAAKYYHAPRLSFHAGRPEAPRVLAQYANPYSGFPVHELLDGVRHAAVGRDWGRFAVLQACGRNVVGFAEYALGSDRGDLVLPFGAPLPRLMARAAAACSGKPPLYITAATVEAPATDWRGYYVFSDVRRDIAEGICVKLGQRLQRGKLKGSWRDHA